MSILGKVVRESGIYDRIKSHFFETMLVPFATQSQINTAEGRFLASITQGLSSQNDIIEIGTLFGRSAQIIITAKKDGQRFFTVDKFRWNPCNLDRIQHKSITEKCTVTVMT